MLDVKEYVKINSLWKREGWYFDQDKKNSPDYQKGKQSFIIGDYAQLEFGNIRRWHVEEKVDGTNIRIHYSEGKVQIGGRTKDAQIPCHLLTYLQNTFDEFSMNRAFPCKENEPHPTVTLYGEGYGAKIQGCGSNYRGDVGFILFDVRAGKWWLERGAVAEIATFLNLPMCPKIGIMEEEQIIRYVKSKPHSLCSITPQVMEGVICRSYPLMLFRSGEPILWKLKCKEFK